MLGLGGGGGGGLFFLKYIDLISAFSILIYK